MLYVRFGSHCMTEWTEFYAIAFGVLNRNGNVERHVLIVGIYFGCECEHTRIASMFSFFSILDFMVCKYMNQILFFFSVLKLYYPHVVAHNLAKFMFIHCIQSNRCFELIFSTVDCSFLNTSKFIIDVFVSIIFLK